MSPEVLAKMIDSDASSPFFTPTRENRFAIWKYCFCVHFSSGMIVAAGASEALPEKCLSDVFGELDRILVKNVIVQGAVLAGAAGVVKMSRAN